MVVQEVKEKNHVASEQIFGIEKGLRVDWKTKLFLCFEVEGNKLF